MIHNKTEVDKIFTPDVAVLYLSPDLIKDVRQVHDGKGVEIKAGQSVPLQFTFPMSLEEYEQYAAYGGPYGFLFSPIGDSVDELYQKVDDEEFFGISYMISEEYGFHFETPSKYNEMIEFFDQMYGL